jgi:tetratricopeptide (TPR) repeat protein
MHPTLNPIFRRVLAASLLAFFAGSGVAADTGPAESADKLAGARAQVAAKQWDRALDELRRVNDTGNADWNNLMGYALRKRKTPDLAGSEKYYDAALRIDPKHRGTLEYSGELYLMKGDLPTAEKRLATLQAVCGTGCPEYADLKNAIDRYKASGQKSSGY